MSIIAVKTINNKLNTNQVVKILAKTIGDHFEVLKPLKVVIEKPGIRICYLSLSEKLDPIDVIEKINKEKRFKAFAPVHLPNDLPVAPKRGNPAKTRQGLRVFWGSEYGEILIKTHFDILIELQSKYTGLFNLSKKTGHKLLDSVAQTLFERLKQIMESNPDASETCLMLSKCYRKLHPHFGDFQLVLSTLHRLQDAAGSPRSQILEHELAAVRKQPHVIENIPVIQVQEAFTKYSDRINKKVSEHIKSLKTEESPAATEEEIARKKVRDELKNLSPYLPLIINQVISNQFPSQRIGHHRVLMYGEPGLPSKELLAPMLQRHGATRVMRSDRMFNLLRFNVPLAQYAALMAEDGTVVDDSKLVIRIRTLENPLYRVPPALLDEMRALDGGAGQGEAGGAAAAEETWEEDVAV